MLGWGDHFLLYIYVNIWLNLLSSLHNRIPVSSVLILEGELLWDSAQTAKNVTVMKTIWNESVFWEPGIIVQLCKDLLWRCVREGIPT